MVILSQISIVNAESNLQGGKKKIAVVPPPNFFYKLIKDENWQIKYRDKQNIKALPLKWFKWDGAKFVHYRTELADRKTIKDFGPPKGDPPTFFVGGKRVKSNIYMDGKWGWTATKHRPPRK